MSIRSDLLSGIGNKDFFRVFVGTLGLVFAAVIGFTVLGDQRLLGNDELSPSTLHIVQDYVYAILILGGTYAFGIRMSRVSWEAIGFRSCDPDWLVRAFLAGVLVYGIRILFDQAMIEIFNQSRMLEPRTTDRAMLKGGSAWLTAFFLFAVTIMTPLATEIFQRGILFAWLRRNFNFIFSAVASAVIFGPLHIGIVRYIQVLVFGIVTAYLYENARSLWAPIAFHMTVSAAYVFGVMGWS